MWWDHVPKRLIKKKKKQRKQKYIHIRTDVPERKEIDFEFQPLRLVLRKEWDVEDPKLGEEGTEVKVMQTAVSTDVIGALDLPVRNILFSYSDTDFCETHEACLQTLRQMKTLAAANNFPDIPYNFMIGRDGTVYEGRGWQRVAEKNDRYEQIEGISLDICNIGKKGATPPIVMAMAAWDLLQYGIHAAVVDSRPIYYVDYA